ncbi:hypothetical protein CEXT_721011 [Caerostris extrusa]|uniref:Uncharacterized protein n=1 Tax=Caerostris extrusa TaxID=172846 RepID=A0AAV4PI06_CAEEX|nr:hypothetical protein CEXT_721011 [Caerostris extrusa]
MSIHSSLPLVNLVWLPLLGTTRVKLDLQDFRPKNGEQQKDRHDEMGNAFALEIVSTSCNIAQTYPTLVPFRLIRRISFENLPLFDFFRIFGPHSLD